MRDNIQHMPQGSAAKTRRPFLSRFRRNKKGSAAVEFALVGLPFFLILYATVETGAIFFAAASIEGATTDAARLIRTGQAQTGSLTQQSIEQVICDKLDFLPNCMSNLHIDVRTFDSFNNVSFPDPIVDGNLAGNSSSSLAAPATSFWCAPITNGRSPAPSASDCRILKTAAACF